MKKIYQLLILTGLLIGTNAKADLLIEPLVGYSFGTLSSDIPGSKDADLNGPSFGGRLGYQNLGFQLGLDYLNSNMNVEDENDDLKATEWAGFVGFKFPILLRVYAGYIFSAKGDLGNQEFDKGTGSKVGLGFTGLPFININLEYRRVAYDETKVGAFKINGADTKYDAYMISISLPFAI